MSRDSVYVVLYGGRETPTETPEDYGSEGPVLGPFDRAECARLSGLDFGADGALHAVGHLLFYGGSYFSRFAVITEERFDDRPALRKRHETFDRAKATPPLVHGLDDAEDKPRLAFYVYEPPDGRRPGDPENEVVFGVFPEDGGGVYKELRVCWYLVTGDRLMPRLEVFIEAFDALWQFRHVQAELARHPHITPAEFCRALSRLGFADITEQQCPVAAAKLHTET
jgi:hypothetical protein